MSVPELPEVEIIVRGLRSLVCGRTICHAKILDDSVLLGDPLDFAQRTCGQRIRSVRRRGKLLILDLQGGDHLVFHLRMTGRLWVVPPGEDVQQYDRLLFFLDVGVLLAFQDQRRFGYAGVFSDQELERWPFYKNLGPEPFEMDMEAFRGILLAPRARIKAVLLDQQRIAGIGNIYADESLFRAGVHPMTPACMLTMQQATCLFASLLEVLQESIAAGGSSIRDYRNAKGEKGFFQNTFAVYGRRGRPCLSCGAVLETVKVAGRTSTYCPCCQPVL